MKVLITGATGLVGSAIAREFINAEHEVFALVRESSDKSLLKEITEKITFLEGDILDILSLEKAIQLVDYVIHAAAVVSFSPRTREQMYKVNIEGTANVVNVCLAKNRAGNTIKKLCFVSSVAALGYPSATKNDKIIIDETRKWEDSPLNSHYAKTKYLAECEIWRGDAEGLNVVIVNPSLVLGEGDWSKSSTQVFKYVYDEKKYYTLGLVNYVDVNDISKAVLQLTLSTIVSERFLLVGGSTTFKDLFERIALKLGKKAPQKLVNPLLSATLWRIEAVRSWLTGSSPLLTKETSERARYKFTYNNNKIKKALEPTFHFSDLEETIERVSKNILANH